MRKATMVIVFFLLSFIASVGAVHGQTSNTMSASLNKSSYQSGDKVVITGLVQQIVNENPVTIIVRNPIGNVYEVGQVTLLNNIFIHDFVIRDDSQNGVYTVNIKYGTQTFELQFLVNAEQLQIIPVFDDVIKVSGDNTALIKYGNVQVSTIDNTISISIDTSRLNKTATEKYQIPKHVIDAQGGQLFVKENSKAVDCIQTESDVQRILECPIETGTKQLMFIGTTVIPEFGPSSLVILALSVVVSLAVISSCKISFSNHTNSYLKP